MKIYIAYKYTNVQNKDELKKSLFDLSQALINKGHTTFVLGRDFQRWDKCGISQIRNAKEIIKNLKGSDVVVAYFNGDEKSTGMSMEMVLAKLLGKKTIILVKNGIEVPAFYRWSAKVLRYNHLNGVFEELCSIIK